MHRTSNGIFTDTFLSSSSSIKFDFKNSRDVFLGGDNVPDMVQLQEHSHIGDRYVDLSSLKKKVMLVMKPGMFHMNVDTLALALEIINDSDYDIIIDTKHSSHLTAMGDHLLEEYFYYVIDHLNKINNNRIKLFSSAKCDAYCLDNYFYVTNEWKPNASSILDLMSTVKDLFHISSAVANENKKIYLSRRYVEKRGPYGRDIIVENKNFTRFRMDDRIVDEEILEGYFHNNGFEVIAPEEFKTIQEQVSFFSDASMIVSSTSSGIANSLFMPARSKVVELVTPFIVDNNLEGTWSIVELLHGQYGPLAYILDHDYARIPNYNRNSNEIVSRIESSNSIKGFLGIGEV